MNEAVSLHISVQRICVLNLESLIHPKDYIIVAFDQQVSNRRLHQHRSKLIEPFNVQILNDSYVSARLRLVARTFDHIELVPLQSRSDVANPLCQSIGYRQVLKQAQIYISASAKNNEITPCRSYPQQAPLGPT